MAKFTRSNFEAYYPEEFRRMEELATDANNCTITLGKKHVTVKIEDPHNMDGLLIFKYAYEPNVEKELCKKLDEIESILRTIYQPLYLAFVPTVKAQLQNISLEHDGAGAYLDFADGRPTESFGYGHDEYERFITRISDLLLSATSAPQKENRCKSGRYCQSCHNAHCARSSDYTQNLWEEMDTETRQKFLDKLSPEEQSQFLQTVTKEGK